LAAIEASASAERGGVAVAPGCAARRQIASRGPGRQQEDPMNGFVVDLEKRTGSNRDFRRVLYTGPNLQLVLMTLMPGEEIGAEVHETTDQFFRVEEGTGKVSIDGRETPIQGGSGVVVPAGARHNVVNTGQQPLKLYTLYSPPHHADGTVHPTPRDAERAEEHFTGKTSE
jgi:mannose-6-phosphate isomerase-like protein (cupin superfamily)